MYIGPWRMGSPGANDNGSGVAALLELSRLFKEIPPEISLRFVAFVNEEPLGNAVIRYVF